MRPVRFASAWWSMQRRLRTNHVLVALSTQKNEVIGSVEVHTAEFLRQRAGNITPEQAALLQPYLASLAVREDARNLGIGRALVKQAIRETQAAARPGDALLLNVETSNAAAVRIYENCGFRVLGGGATVVMRRQLDVEVEDEDAVESSTAPGG